VAVVADQFYIQYCGIVYMIKLTLDIFTRQ